MILAGFGHEHAESDLRRLLRTRAAGTSPANLMIHLPELGFDAFVLDGSLAALQATIEEGKACIVHLWTLPLPDSWPDSIHAVVVVDVGDDKVSVNDPNYTDGPTEIPLGPFMQAWSATDHLMITIVRRT